MRMILLFFMAAVSINTYAHDCQRDTGLTPAISTTQPISGTKISQTNGTSGYTITQSGYYYLSSDINYSPTGTGRTAIIINANNVTLDLGGRTIFQGNSAASTIAIKVDSSSNSFSSANGRNITIKNGRITNFTATTTGAISVTSGCQDIVLDSLEVTNCSGTGIYVTGSQRFKILNSFCGNNTSTTAAIIAGLNAVSTNDIVIRSCDFSFNSTNQAVTVSGARFDNCTGIAVYDSRATNNTNTNATPAYTTFAHGWSITNATGSCKNFYFYNCRGNSQSASAGTAHGFYINSATGGYFENCIADFNQSPLTSGAANTLDGLNAYGFFLLSSNACIFQNCRARYQLVGNSNTTAQYRDAVGFYSRLGNGNKFIGCEAAYNSSGGTFNSSDSINGNTAPAKPGSWPNQLILYGYIFNPITGNISAPTLGEQTSYSAGFYLHAETGSVVRECSAYSNNASNPSTRTSPAATTPIGPSSNNGIAVGILLNRLGLSFSLGLNNFPQYTVQACRYCLVINNLTYNNQSLDINNLATCRSIGLWEHAQSNTPNNCWQYNEVTYTGIPTGDAPGSTSVYSGNVSWGQGKSWGRGNIAGGGPQFGGNLLNDPTLVNTTSNTIVAATTVNGGFNFWARYDNNNTGAAYFLEATFLQQTNVNSNNTGNSNFGAFSTWNWSFIQP